MNALIKYFSSSIGRKQIVASSSLLLILFLIGHLAGNLLIYGGPDIFNGYALKLSSLGLLVRIVELVLLLVFLVHIFVTALLVWDNIQARGTQRYAIQQPVGDRSWATRLMPFTGTYILIFVCWHLKDFTFSDHSGPLSVLQDGRSYGLYGVVWNAFASPVHSVFYILAMIAVGLHLTHGIQSFCQTFGFNHPRYTPMIQRFSNAFGILIAAGFSSIPVYVLLQARG